MIGPAEKDVLARIEKILRADALRNASREAYLRHAIGEPHANLGRLSRQLSEIRGRQQGISWVLAQVDAIRTEDDDYYE